MLLPIHNVFTESLSVSFDLEMPVSLATFTAPFDLPNYIIQNLNTSQ